MDALGAALIVTAIGMIVMVYGGLKGSQTTEVVGYTVAAIGWLTIAVTMFAKSEITSAVFFVLLSISMAFMAYMKGELYMEE